MEGGDQAFDNLEDVGLAIKSTSLGYHCGFFYVVDGGEPRFLHLAFHHDLRDEMARPDYFWINLKYPSIRKRSLAAYLSIIKAANENQIAYGFDTGDGAFDPDNGYYSTTLPGKGLTCATFVYKLLEARGYHLIDFSTWEERAEDSDWFTKIIEAMRLHGASAEHIEAMQNNLPARRLRPTEIVGAALADDRPVSFVDAKAMAEQIVVRMASLAA
ncbi:MAG: hypothetical protein NVV72_10970 [Asticcacaulis sp.]|nr:hypothetical protein [Asticcacaulis sp.]